MSGLAYVRLVAAREIRERGFTPAYLIFGLALPGALALFLLSGAQALGAEIAQELSGWEAGNSDGSAKETERNLAFTVVAIPLILATFTASPLMGAAVIEEKSTRIIEVLLATVRPRRLLAGKMVGIGLLALLPVAIVDVSAIVAIAVSDLSDLLPGLTAGRLPVMVLWFLLGYGFFVVLSGTLASLASQPDENFWQVLVMLLVWVGFFAGSATVADPHSAFAVAVSYVPFTAPFVVPARALTGDITAWAHLLAAALMVAVMVPIWLAAARIYAGSSLRVHGRTRIGDAYRSAEL